jgi:hypothetical protein
MSIRPLAIIPCLTLTLAAAAACTSTVVVANATGGSATGQGTTGTAAGGANPVGPVGSSSSGATITTSGGGSPFVGGATTSGITVAAATSSTSGMPNPEGCTKSDPSPFQGSQCMEVFALKGVPNDCSPGEGGALTLAQCTELCQVVTPIQVAVTQCYVTPDGMLKAVVVCMYQC